MKERMLYGLTTNRLTKAYNGFTLFSVLGSKTVKLINMKGKTVHSWEMPNKAGLYGELLENENLLYAGYDENGPLKDFEGAGGVIMEVDWNGKTIWEYKDPYLHHGFCRMKNGNTLAIKWVELSDDLASKVEGGFPNSEKDGKMYGDAIIELDQTGKVVWQWNAFEKLDPKDDPIYPTVERKQWTTANSVYELDNGKILISFRRICTLAIINKSTGEIEWKWGAHEISHQNSAVGLENGNILFFDNGFHQEGIHHPFSRVVELDIEKKSMVWEYRDRDNDNINLFSDFMASCQRLPNGNTLIVDSVWGRIFEVTKGNEIVWEYVNPEFNNFIDYGNHNVVTRAFRYGVDHPGLKGNKELRLGQFIQTEADIEKIKRIQSGGKEPEPKSDSSVQSRLEQLGY